jgi:hypothetical protein
LKSEPFTGLISQMVFSKNATDDRRLGNQAPGSSFASGVK